MPPAKKRTAPYSERIAVLETQVAHFGETIDSVDKKLDAVLAQQQKYKGFWGAVTLFLSALWAVFTFFRSPNGN